jgi:DNA mismatch repair protein MutS
MSKKQSASPVRRQYLSIKRQYPDAILFFRLGDFYETFDEDAQTASRELDIVLTSRNVAKGVRVPMAGIPFHAAENYISRLIEKGYHVAICEQMGEAPQRGLFPRQVVRVVTPGTVVEPGLLPGDLNNYLAAVVVDGQEVGVAYADVTTGEFAATQFESAQVLQGVRQELARLRPAEVLFPEKLDLMQDELWHRTALPDWRFERERARERLLEHFRASTLDGFGLADKPLAACAAGAIVSYLQETQPAALPLLTGLATYSLADFMVLDASTRRNLELTETLIDGEVHGSLLGVIDGTVTPMGKRLMRQWIAQPLLEEARINQRLDQVASAMEDGVWRAELRRALGKIGDLERLANRASSGIATPRDLVAMREILFDIPPVVNLLLKAGSSALAQAHAGMDPCVDVTALLERAIADEPPATLAQSGVIRRGYSEKLDQVVDTSRQAREWISNLEAIERERTRIKSLKVGYNKVFGYYIEVTKANTDLVPAEYIRKQTLVNAERYITPEMKEYESQVITAEDRIRELEAEIFAQVCRSVGAESARLLEAARHLANMDVISALAEVAAREGYVRPEIAEEEILDIREGRHPVVEKFMEAGRFVPNDTVFEEGERLRVITGPNMSGKSTYLRQVALIVLLAQIGSFVPARSARIGLSDRIFTRIGARDEIHAGQSTFMVEMVETANILHHATRRSLLILDEIGRGTSTYDGISIAWAVVEFIHNYPQLRARTLFATHYHELTRLAEVLPGVRNYNVAVAEEGGEVIFLHKIVPGGADRSYGIHVAELAGLPRPVISRAQEILAQMESEARHAQRGEDVNPSQLALFPLTNPLIEELKALQIDALSPMQALNKLYEWHQRFLEKDEHS